MRTDRNNDVGSPRINCPVMEPIIAQLLSPFLNRSHLSPERLEMVRTYLELLLKWNKKVNLTSGQAPEEIISRHFGESFFAARHLLTDDNQDFEAVDVGSGAGFPGLPLKIWNPNLRLTLVESNQRKATFLREVIRALGLTQAQVLSRRAEELVVTFDVVTIRAIERFARILPVALRILRPKGQIGLLIGSSQLEVTGAHETIHWREPIPVPVSRERVLLIGSCGIELSCDVPRGT